MHIDLLALQLGKGPLQVLQGRVGIALNGHDIDRPIGGTHHIRFQFEDIDVITSYSIHYTKLYDSHATNRIAEGEVLQLLNVHNPETSEADYMEVIKRKTATLFEGGARLGGVRNNFV